MIRLIAGLGNPGDKYERTRHNVGFRAVDKLLEISRPSSERLMKQALLYETERFGLLCKPLTYMNRSGKPLQDLATEFMIQPSEILVVYDDFALDLGLLRIRERGSAGGHNGLQSIIDYFGTTEIPRVRLGIKTEEMDEWVDFVLGKFKRSEEKIVEEMLDLCSEAVEATLTDGITAAMNRYNRKQKQDNGSDSN
jgi:PTH1 family peptidyl-tRNA hydrolase